jgi:hypothetical protein
MNPLKLLSGMAGKAVSKAYDLPQSIAKNLSEKSTTDPVFAAKLNNILNFRIMAPKNKKLIQNFAEDKGALGGFGLGGLGGASLEADSIGERVNNTLLGSVGGALGGAGGI